MGKARIVIDARMVGAMGHGIGNYVLDLAAALENRSLPFELFFLLQANCPAHSPLRMLPHAESKVPFLSLQEPWALAREVIKLKPALYHSPSFSSLASYPCPHIQTIHDLIHLDYGGPLRRAYYRCLLLPSLKRATEIHVVSRSSRAALKAWLNNHGIEKELHLAFNAIAPMPKPQEKFLEEKGLEKNNYFFCLSNPKQHKNVDFLLRAHQKASARAKILPLAVNVEGPSQEGIIRLPHLKGEEISALFAHARAYYFPSLVEGFGRSPLEAALCGTKPIASDIPAHREALQIPEAIFLDPKNSALWEESFLQHSLREKEKISSESIAWIQKTYSLEQLGNSVEQSYRRALALKS